MYENQYPQIDELVIATVRKIESLGVYVTLPEYNNVEGMIPLSELSRKRIRSMASLIRVGRSEAVMVLRVDDERGYIDLSKRRVQPEEIGKAEERFLKSKMVQSMMRQVAEHLDTPLEEIHRAVTWPLNKKYGHALDGFKIAMIDPDRALEGLELNPQLRHEVLNQVRRRLTPQAVKLRADIEVTCFGYEGIDAVKKALFAGEAVSTEETTIRTRLVAPPLYVMTTSSLDKVAGIKLMEESILAMERVITGDGGALTVKMMPRAVSETDDKELERLMERAEQETKEVGGDDEDSEPE
ncbi:hypothetical protein M427DRAFT_125508 [Gonapodya prolifera JEL478]|uniref:S1 motif domain-containing protein n=1 Tax=Gonapodya prolifera (strain JEL478) TaxID=1344416 RepID=A0A139A7M7_GONPJ|nr:hypothetical protein M427DRAFT_125508 [Gonapodya prolifera JEL478]|eukprot:KXS12678.1 hypothetical protein M427DRAFT_125508 [Gonapodya prolifera JEL478]